MLPLFPETVPLELAHKREIQSKTAKYKPYSDFNFTSLFAWNTHSDAKVASLNDNLIVRFPDYISDEPVTSLLGCNDIDATLNTLLAHVDVLQMVPEAVVAAIQSPQNYLIEEDRGNFDYIYELRKIESLEGQDYKKKRNKINGIVAGFGSRLTSITYDTVDSEVAQLLETGFLEWAKQRNKTDEDINSELDALRRVLRYHSQLGVFITVVQLDANICGFSINEVIDNRFAICHFEKDVSGIDGMATYIAYEAIRELNRRGCQFVNWEQDLGLPGLRQAKETWHPDSYLRKYNIRRL